MKGKPEASRLLFTPTSPQHRSQRVRGTVTTAWETLRAFVRRGIGIFRLNQASVRFDKLLQNPRRWDRIVVPVEFGNNRADRRAAEARDRLQRRRIKKHNDRLLSQLGKITDTDTDGDP